MKLPGRRLTLLAPPLLAMVAVILLLLGLGGATGVAEANGGASRCFATPDEGATLFQSSTFTPVQAAVDKLGAGGGTVRVAGSCAGVQGRHGLTQTVYISAPLTLRGGYTTTDWMVSNPVTNPTVLDAQGGGRVVTATGALTVENLTIQNGSSASSGGGVYAGGAVTVVNSRFQNNESTGGDGGGLFAASTLFLTGTQIVSNTASSGGGVNANGVATVANSRFENNQSTGSFGEGGALFANSTLVLTDTQIVSNTARDDGGGVRANGAVTVANSRFENNQSTGSFGEGGGLFALSTLVMTGTQILSNTASDRGGGVFANRAATVANSYFENNGSIGSFGEGGGLFANSRLFMTGTQILSNTAQDDGGGVRVNGAATVASSQFENNESGGGWGGGLYAASTLDMTGTQILSNTAAKVGGGLVARGAAVVANTYFGNNRSLTLPGGGIYASDELILRNSLLVSNSAPDGGGIFADGSALALTNSTLAANHAITKGGGLFFTTGSLSIGNSILWDNRPDQLATSGGATSVERSIIEDGRLGGINQDPRFERRADPAAGDLGDLHLRQDSPGIDAGNDSLVPAGLTTDLDGLSRLFDVTEVAKNGANIVDMGAYELHSQLVLPAAEAGGPYAGAEGFAIALDGSGSTTVVDMAGYAWDCTDDGIYDTISTQATGNSCSYADNGTFTVRLLVTDTGGLTATNRADVTVSNVAPRVTPAADQSATEAISSIFLLGFFTDPGDDDPWSATVNWGDGSVDTLSDVRAGRNLPVRAHTYAASASYTVIVSVDDGEESGSATFKVTVNAASVNKPPSFTNSPTLLATEGLAYSYNVTTQDTDSGDVMTITAPTKPGWLVLSATDKGTANGVAIGEASLAGTPGNSDLGANPVVLRVEDRDGVFATQSFTITVSAAPTATGAVLGTVVDESGAAIEGAQVTLTDEASFMASNEGDALQVALVRTERTDAGGAYRFDAVPAGSYSITISAGGYRSPDALAVIVGEGETVEAGQTVLQEGSNGSALYLPTLTSNAVVSAARVEEMRAAFLPALVR